MNPTEAVPLEGLLAALVCAAVGSLYAAADAALGSLNPGRLSALHEEATGRSKAALGRYLADPTRLHSRWLVGRVTLTSLAAVLIALAFRPIFASPWALVVVGALGSLVTYGTMAEIATTIARRRADSFARRLLGFMRPLEWLVLPLAAPLAALGRAASSAMGPDEPPDARMTETEVEWAVTEGQKSGSLAEEPAEMIRNVLDLKDLVARDVMVPRTRVSAIEIDTPLDEVLRFVASEGHSRYPVYREKIDNVVGLLYAKDLFKVVESGALASTRLRAITRTPVNFVPESQGVSTVLREMRQRRLHLAVVIDEYGGMSGLVTLEDILEEIVGDIRDEYDVEEPPIQDLGDGHLLADAAVSVHDLSAYLGAEIPADEDYDSLGGMLVHRAGRVPPAGTTMELFGLSFVVRDADEKRIAKVEIIRPPSETMPPSLRPSGIEGVPSSRDPGGEAEVDEGRKMASAPS